RTAQRTGVPSPIRGRPPMSATLRTRQGLQARANVGRALPGRAAKRPRTAEEPVRPRDGPDRSNPPADRCAANLRLVTSCHRSFPVPIDDRHNRRRPNTRKSECRIAEAEPPTVGGSGS
ncbi:MAG: hypothetical protein D6725_11830, partial [Planctomycetota bacterium]